MTHYITGQFSTDAATGRRRANLVAVCGHVREHALDLSDVQSLIDCEACRDWIRKNEEDAHRLKLVENAWKGPDASKGFWDEKMKRWDI